MSTKSVIESAEEAGFKIELSKEIEEIRGIAHVFTHETGARLLFLENDDNNKGFSITFKTPASDDTGVFHILEHSVLCGSRKYPVKEPFVNLLKSSMQTFLNAMTFPDKTMYPVASTNNRDLMNLASVYLDAVFHPNIYTNKRIFEQEGWHLEFDQEAGGNLEYNGVVFNEMKGALSDSDSVLFDTLSAALFPDTTYRYESGGTPEAIPTLEYGSFLDTHARHYRPANSYIVLYGNIDAPPFFEMLDETLKNAGNARLQINPLDLQPPVRSLGVKKDMVTSPDSSCAALGFVVGRAGERERILEIQVLIDAIMGSNEAPMKRALLDSDIADEVEGYTITSLAQPFVVVSARGLHGEDAAENLASVTKSVAKELSEGGLDDKVVEAALNHAEFAMREGEFGIADGVHYSMAAMLGWLYDDTPEAPLLYIQYEEVLKSIRNKLHSGYFANLVKDVFLDNDHMASAQIIPIEGDIETAQEIELKAMQAKMSPEELVGISEEAASLHEAQMIPDSPEALSTLPKLSRKDIESPLPEPICRFCKLGDIEVMRHEVDTRGIVYASKYFNMDILSFEEIPYASILSMVLGKMGTQSHSASDIDTLAQSDLGSLSFSCETYADPSNPERVNLYFAVKASCLSKKVPQMAALTKELLTQTVFDDKVRLENILTQYKVGKEQQFVMSGDGVASTRASSYTMPASVVAEQISNIDFYKFVKRLLDDFDDSAEELAHKLNDIAARLFVDDGCLLSFAGRDEDYEAYCDTGGELGCSSESREKRLVVPPPEEREEAFAVPADIAYCALAINRNLVEDVGAKFSGLWMMASRVLSYDYLWNEVRVVGGAYGVRFSTARTGSTAFSSFRDPHVTETLDRFRASGEWLSNYDPQEDEFEGFVVSTAASFDKPLKPRALILRQTGMYLGRYPYNEFLEYRSQVLKATIDDLKGLTGALDEICKKARVCVVGNKALLEQSELPVTVTDLFDI